MKQENLIQDWRNKIMFPKEPTKMSGEQVKEVALMVLKLNDYIAQLKEEEAQLGTVKLETLQETQSLRNAIAKIARQYPKDLPDIAKWKDVPIATSVKTREEVEAERRAQNDVH
jgi:hypothetical protein